MMTIPIVNIGDGSTSKTFTKVERSVDGKHQLSCTVKALPGTEFVVLLVGEVKAGTVQVDVDKMLADLGYVPKKEANEGRRLFDLCIEYGAPMGKVKDWLEEKLNPDGDPLRKVQDKLFKYLFRDGIKVMQNHHLPAKMIVVDPETYQLMEALPGYAPNKTPVPSDGLPVPKKDG